MGVISTGSIFKTLTFDGRSSSEFNVYITGEGVFNAPERAVEMISIPGRNGAFAMDYGRFENIEVTYNCGIAGDDDADFASAISDFRNWLCSRNGYVRLSDDYNTGEYRLAIYKSGLEVTAENLKAGEFPVVFECKPQRFLTSGETAVAVTSGDDITNPTLFPSNPLLAISGRGWLDIGGDTITLNNAPIGWTVVTTGASSGQSLNHTYTVSMEYANTNDAIVVVEARFRDESWLLDDGTDIVSYSASATGNGSATASIGYDEIVPRVQLNNVSFAYGTALTATSMATFNIVTQNYGTLTGTIAVSLAYDGDDEFTLTATPTKPAHFNIGNTSYRENAIGTVKLNSSKSSLGNPLYIDLDIGEAYKIENGVVVSVNNAVELPAQLPQLSPGANTVTYQNTITQLKITPRWWKI